MFNIFVMKKEKVTYSIFPSFVYFFLQKKVPNGTEAGPFFINLGSTQLNEQLFSFIFFASFFVAWPLLLPECHFDDQRADQCKFHRNKIRAVEKSFTKGQERKVRRRTRIKVAEKIRERTRVRSRTFQMGKPSARQGLSRDDEFSHNEVFLYDLLRDAMWFLNSTAIRPWSRPVLFYSADGEGVTVNGFNGWAEKLDESIGAKSFRWPVKNAWDIRGIYKAPRLRKRRCS
jgi:hypothetical protein